MQRFQWVAVLEDGTLYKEFKEDGSENSYSTIPRERVQLFGLESTQSTYFIDTKTGEFHIKGFGRNGAIKLQIPWKGKIVPLTGELGPWQKYNFWQLKSGGYDIFPRVGQFELEKHTLGWSKTMLIQGFGAMNVDTMLQFDPREKIVKPFIEIKIGHTNVDKNHKNYCVAGSPYKIQL